jgi:hypothetical protein
MRRDGSIFSRYANSIITLLAFSALRSVAVSTLNSCRPAGAALFDERPRMRELGTKDWRGRNDGKL